MLDVQRRIDVDPDIEDFLDVLVALDVPGSRGRRPRKS